MSESKKEIRPLPFGYHFLAGGMAGVMEILVMYPLDVVKTRFQLSVGKSEYKSIMDCFKQIVKSEGFLRLYRGILPPIFIEAPKRATKFATNEKYNQLCLKIFDKPQPNQLTSSLAGIGAGITEAFVVVSFELVKIRLQDRHNAGKYNGTLDCIWKIFKEEGPLAFFNGLEATIWRHAAWTGGYFSVIHKIRDVLPKPKSKQEEFLRNFTAGTIGGTVGTVLNTPFDVVKTRIQNQSPGNLKYNWTLPALRTVIKEEGALALYKGFIPKVLRLGPGGGILLLMFDMISNFIRKNFSI